MKLLSALSLLMFLIALQGCGSKGPLYLPQPGSAQSAPDKPADNNQQSPRR
jgi:predicted small lipoprotein YifL